MQQFSAARSIVLSYVQYARRAYYDRHKAETSSYLKREIARSLLFVLASPYRIAVSFSPSFEGYNLLNQA